MPMKKITFNALLNHKAHNYKPMQIEVEKVIPLYGKRFEQMRDHPLEDAPEIIDNKDLMYMKGNTAHCILFLEIQAEPQIYETDWDAPYEDDLEVIPSSCACGCEDEINAAIEKYAEPVEKHRGRACGQKVGH